MVTLVLTIWRTNCRKAKVNDLDYSTYGIIQAKHLNNLHKNSSDFGGDVE